MSEEWPKLLFDGKDVDIHSTLKDKDVLGITFIVFTKGGPGPEGIEWSVFLDEFSRQHKEKIIKGFKLWEKHLDKL